jgi:hypothetical protein
MVIFRAMGGLRQVTKIATILVTPDLVKYNVLKNSMVGGAEDAGCEFDMFIVKDFSERRDCRKCFFWVLSTVVKLLP